MTQNNNNSWDTLIDYTRAEIEKDNLDWLTVKEFTSGTRVALLSNIIGQYMRAIEGKEKDTGTPTEPDFTEFKKLFSGYYKTAKRTIIKDITSDKYPIEIPKKELATKPNEHALTTDKISNKAFLNVFTNGVKAVLAMEKKGSAIQVNTYVTVNYDGLDRAKVHGVKWLTLFDRSVLDAVHTLYSVGNRFITIDQINRVMCGKSGEEKATAGQAERINNSLTKMMYTQITIDATQEAEFFGYNSFVYDKPVIVGERGKATLNGTTVTGIYIYSLALLSYANNKNQIARIPLEVKDTPINKNENGIILQDYLIRQINYMKSGGRSNRILLDNLLNDLNIIDTSKAKLTSAEANNRKKTIEQITALLDYWKNAKFINSYDIDGKRPVKAFVIYVG